MVEIAPDSKTYRSGSETCLWGESKGFLQSADPGSASPGYFNVAPLSKQRIGSESLGEYKIFREHKNILAE